MVSYLESMGGGQKSDAVLQRSGKQSFIYLGPTWWSAGVQRNALVQMIDWAPTLLEFFNQPIPADVQGHPLAKILADDTPVRDAALFGVFSGHVNVTDGRYVICARRYPDGENDIANYTLMPIKMNTRFDVAELQSLTLSLHLFTKGLNVAYSVPEKYPRESIARAILLF